MMSSQTLAAILTPSSWLYVFLVFALAFAVGFLYRFVLRKMTTSESRRARKNINTSDRWFRAMLGFAFLIFAITTNWDPWILFFSGFCFFEAIFSWCGLNAALGRNTCPVE